MQRPALLQFPVSKPKATPLLTSFFTMSRLQEHFPKLYISGAFGVNPRILCPVVFPSKHPSLRCPYFFVPCSRSHCLLPVPCFSRISAPRGKKINALGSFFWLQHIVLSYIFCLLPRKEVRQIVRPKILFQHNPAKLPLSNRIRQMLLIAWLQVRNNPETSTHPAGTAAAPPISAAADATQESAYPSSR